MRIKVKILKYLSKLYTKIRKKREWSSNLEMTKLKAKNYSNYKDYISHQKSKLFFIKDIKMVEYEKKFYTTLYNRIKKNKFVKDRSTVLCLAARMGAEVRAFQKAGCFAVGIDLNPGKENKYVLYGDFHNLQFADNTVDIVYSNSFDHVYDLKRVLGEVRRVLVPKGILLLEVMVGEKEGLKAGYWESMSWSKIDDLVAEIKNEGFDIKLRHHIRYPWKGESLVLIKR